MYFGFNHVVKKLKILLYVFKLVLWEQNNIRAQMF